jgi:hypothetical protein
MAADTAVDGKFGIGPAPATRSRLEVLWAAGRP